MGPVRKSVVGTAVVLVLVTLGGCTPDGTAPEPEESEPVVTEPTADPVEDVTTEDDALVACALFGEGGEESLMQRIAPALTGIGSTITGEQIDELLYINSGLSRAADVAPDDLAAALAALNRPFQQAADAVASGGGGLSMDTSHVMEDVTEVMELCVDAGFTISTG